MDVERPVHRRRDRRARMMAAIRRPARAGRLRRARRGGNGRGDQGGARERARRSSASASACRWRSSSSRATCAGSTTRTRASSRPKCSTCGRLADGEPAARAATWAARCASARTRAGCARARKAAEIYGVPEISERHRHRYEVSNQFRELFQEKGMRLSGLSPDSSLVEMIELPDHPHFVGVPVPSRAQEPSHAAAPAVRGVHRGRGDRAAQARGARAVARRRRDGRRIDARQAN